MCNVDVATGELTRVSTDVVLTGAIPFEFSRVYSSRDPSPGPLGHGWRSNANLFLQWDQQGVAFHDEDGESVRLAVVAGEGRAASDDASVTLERAGALLLLRRGDRRRYYFESRPRARGVCRIDSIRDRNDQALRFHYSPSGLLAGVTGTTGREALFRYDDAQRLVAIGVRAGRQAAHLSVVRRFFFDGANDLVETMDEIGRVTRYAYRDHLMTRETGPDGNSVYWVYDGSRRCVLTWLEGGIRLRRFRHDDRRGRVEVCNSLGQRTIYERDDGNRIVGIVDPIGRRVTHSYDAAGLLIGTTGGDASARAVSVFDEQANCLTVVQADGRSVKHHFDDANLPVRIEDDEGNVWLKAYDERGRLVRSVAPGGIEWRFAYAQEGYVCRAVDPCGHAIQQARTRDAAHMRDDTGIVYRRDYGEMGDLIAVVDGAGRRTTFHYDAAGRQTRIVFPDGTSSQCAYDANDNIVSVTDPLGRTVRMDYDAGGMPVRETLSNGDAFELRYDTEQQLTGIVNLKGETASIRYDAVGRLTDVTLFDGRIERYDYDESDRLIQITRPSGRRMRIEYDDNGAVARRIASDGTATSFVYRKGLLEAATSGEVRFDRTFDARGRLIGETQGAFDFALSYDKVDNLIAVQANVGRSTRYAYDGRRRLVSLNDSALGDFTFVHDEVDLLRQTHCPGGARIENTFDVQDRLVQVEAFDAAGLRRLTLSYEYDAADRLVAETLHHANAVRTTRYAYDHRDQVVSVMRGDETIERYAYDANGNIVFSSRHGAAHVGPGDRLLQFGAALFQYDDDGNLIERRDDTGVTRFDYDAEYRLTRLSLPDGSVIDYAYDAIGRRVRKRVAGRETRIGWNGETVYREVSDEGVIDYLFLPDSFVPLAFAERGRRLFCVMGQNGAPCAMLDEAGHPVWIRDTDVYGNDIAAAPRVRCPTAYLGQYRDADSALRYNYHRYYDPRMGRFISIDPIGFEGGFNLYRFVSNTLTTIDPLGLFEIELFARCDWNKDQKAAFQEKVNRYNKAIATERRKKKDGIFIQKCDRLAKNLRDEYRKCGNKEGPPSDQSPKDKGKPVDCKDDIDHIVDCQMGGPQSGPELCNNLRPVNASVNRSIGSQVRNQLKGKNLSEALTKVVVGTRDCAGVSERTPECG
ncbi:ImpA family type VI secretion-associated protein [Caballeronia catudaia]|uniref:ImpA family type VI secretion-associated protein n=1 Tax=Caballeronia catudaia TaxID=1777136 RepID=A0A158D5E9_9BURK|nr:RHS repeat-associated core domain-containing protein [Caballeronia catudaia]SAK89693.1 ImpA family type VI secretion-associated protein [Caballeronia catudaia]